ncbi:ERAP1-like C-terminal domain-containing protein [Microbacterium sp. CH12i]|uniref:ERAP1-like C-terminal domain-containing protein n=1 Tax=Microbacterium sp. CH12i TaxID=1479651 RepID=UPI003FA58B70
MLVQSDPRPHRLRVGLYDLVDGRLSQREKVELDIRDARTTVNLQDADLALLNDDDLTYAKSRLDERSLASVERALSSLEPLPRALVWSSLWNATRDGELSVARYLAIVAAHAPVEENIGLLSGVLANAAYAVGHFTPDEDRSAQRTAWLDTTWNALTNAEAGSDAQLSWARAFAAASAYDDSRAVQVRAMLDGDVPAGLTVDPDLRWTLLSALTTTGHAAFDDVETELERDDTASGRTAALCALAARPVEAVRLTAWHQAWEDRALSNDHLSAIIAGVRAGGRRDLISELDNEYFARIAPAWHDRSIELARRLVLGLFPASDDLGLVDNWLSSNEDAPAALRRLVIEQRDHLARDLRVRTAQASPSD